MNNKIVLKLLYVLCGKIANTAVNITLDKMGKIESTNLLSELSSSEIEIKDKGNITNTLFHKRYIYIHAF